MNKNIVEVGSLFVSSWGYDQTNVDFYQAIALTKTGKSVTVRKIASVMTTNGCSHMTGLVTPDINNFIGPAITKKLHGTCFRLESYASTTLLTDVTKKHFVSWYA